MMMGLVDLTPYVHPLALCESRDVGSATRIWPFAHVMDGAKIGKNCNIGEHVFVESGAVIGDRCTIKNGAMIWDGVKIEDDVFVGPGVIFTNDRHPRAHNKDFRLLATSVSSHAVIGAGSVITPGITIGRYAFIGAGSVVTRDVYPHQIVYGNPAVTHGYLCECGDEFEKTGHLISCPRCALRYRFETGFWRR